MKWQRKRGGLWIKWPTCLAIVNHLSYWKGPRIRGCKHLRRNKAWFLIFQKEILILAYPDFCSELLLLSNDMVIEIHCSFWNATQIQGIILGCHRPRNDPVGSVKQSNSQQNENPNLSRGYCWLLGRGRMWLNQRGLMDYCGLRCVRG